MGDKQPFKSDNPWKECALAFSPFGTAAKLNLDMLFLILMASLSSSKNYRNGPKNIVNDLNLNRKKISYCIIFRETYTP